MFFHNSFNKGNDDNFKFIISQVRSFLFFILIVMAHETEKSTIYWILVNHMISQRKIYNVETSNF